MKSLWKLLMLIVIVAVGGLSGYLYTAMNKPVEHAKSEDYLTISYGSTPNKIAELLEQEGIIASAFPLKVYFKLINRSPGLQAGDYLFPSPVTPLEILSLLKEGKKRTKSLSIPEGWTRFEIADRIVNQFPSEEYQNREAVLALMKRTELIEAFDPSATSLEGYLYPSTYQLEEDATAADIIAIMVGQFKSVWQPEWDTAAQKLNRTRGEILTIASLIENESKIDAERPLVASVIYNRLKRGMPLGIDATNIYIAKLLGKWDGIIHKSDLEIDHPYNTRKIRGLPPGPISSPSRSAIEAALHPASTKYLFYVLNVDNNNGSHHFYATNSGFLEGKKAYQRWLQTQR